MSMPAVVNYAPEKHSVELRDLPAPTIGDEDVLLEVKAVGVCGSDLHQWTSDHSWPVNYPVVLGHEFAGAIKETGRRVRGFAVGDRVVSETAAVIDPDSPFSRQGRYNLDPSRKGFGYGVDGAMTKLVRVPSRCLHHLPDALDFERASLTEPCCVAYNAVVENSTVVPGARVVVLGPGPIGILCGAMAKLAGADVAILGLPRDEHRLKVARKFDLTPVLPDELNHWVYDQGDHLGVDGVIDAAGASVALKTALEIVRPNGWITKVGWGPQPLGFSLDPLVQKNITLRGSFSHHWRIWEAVVQLIATGKLAVDKIIGGKWTLDHWHDAFETMHGGQIVKAVLLP